MKKIAIIIVVFSIFVASFNIALAENLSERLTGRILLQVEANGEAWYIHPGNQKRHFLGRPADAFEVMRELGLGISNADFANFENNMPVRLLGQILIKVEDFGKAYYINPLDKKANFLGRPADAFALMRSLGLGITTASLTTIEEDEKSQTRRQTQEQAQKQLQTGTEDEINTKEELETEGKAEGATEELATSTGTIASRTEETASSTEKALPIYASENCEFSAEYFKGETISGAANITQTEYGINHEWGVNGSEALSAYKNKFSVRFIGNCYFEEGTYEFTSIFDDGIKATLDNLWLAKSWKNNNKEVTKTTTLAVPEGTHRVKVEYYDHLGNATIKLDWKKID